MKKFITIALLFAASLCHGQAKRLIVTNTTRCTVYYQILTSNLSAPCVVANVSSFIAVPPGTYTYLYNTVPGLPAAARYILAARCFYAPPACPSITPAPPFLGELCSGYPQFTTMFWKTAICEVCSQGYAKWVPTTSIGGDAYLYFYP